MNEVRRADAGAEPSPGAPGVVWLAGALIGVFGLVGYLFWALNGGLVKDGNWIGVDFHTYYQAALALRRGADIYGPDISPPYVYPPLLAALVIPLSWLPVTAATILWKLLQHTCLLVAGVLLVNMLPKGVRPLGGGLLLLGLLTVPVQDEIQVGESNSLILLLVVGAVWLISREVASEDPQIRGWGALSYTTVGAGLLLALAVSIKVLPALLVAYFWWRGPRMVAATATAGFLLVQLFMLVATPATANYWFTQFPGLFGQAFPFLDNQSINAFLARALTPGGDPAIPPMQIASGEAVRPLLTWALNLVALAGTVAVLWLAGRKQRGLQESARSIVLLLEVALVLLTIHLVSGSTWLHHLIDLSVPMVAMLGAWWLSSGDDNWLSAPKWGTVIFAAAVGAALALLLHRPGDWVQMASTIAPLNAMLALLASGMGLWVVVGLWAGVARVLLKKPDTK